MGSTALLKARDGARSRTDRSAIERNRLLARLPESEAAIMEEITEDFQIISKDLMTEAGGALTHLHFPQTGVISLVTVLKDGGCEALTVGNDGMTGFQLLHGCNTTFCRVIGQIPGNARRVAVGTFLKYLDELPELRRRSLLYAQLAFEAASQSAACNRLHVTEERCARWLLLSQDRVGRDEFQLTQGFLSQMLGVRRPAVTVAIGVLARAGLIEHERGLIRIVDRQRLEEASCECYSYVRKREVELLGSDSSD